MKYLCIFVALVCHYWAAFSQKPPLDISVLGRFPVLAFPLSEISNNGRFVSYRIAYPGGDDVYFLVIQETEGRWKREFVGASSAGFSGDSKQIVFVRDDTLCFLHLGGERVECRPGILSYKKPRAGNGKWLAYQLKAPQGKLVLRNLLTGKERYFDAIEDYSFDDKGGVLLLKTSSALQWIELPKGDPQTIWASETVPGSGKRIGGYNFDVDGEQLTFLQQEDDPAGRVRNTIWYYRRGADKAILMAGDTSPGIGDGLFIGSSIPFFNENGRYVFFQLQAPEDERKPDPDAARVNVWSYKDSVLQSAQVNNTFGPIEETGRSFAAVIPVGGSRALRLEEEDEVAGIPGKNDMVLLRTKNSIVDYWWPSFAEKRNWLVSFKDSSLKRTPVDINFFHFSYFSPGGRFLVYYDLAKQQYFSYDLSTGQVVNISQKVPVSLGNEDFTAGLPRNPLHPVGVAGWLADESAILVYDNYDVWQLDPAGRRSPINITNGYGRRRHIRFRLVNEEAAMKGLPQQASLLLTAFNMSNKYNGFYRTTLRAKGDPELLTMGPYTIYHHLKAVSGIERSENSGMPPIKAREADAWIVTRQSATEAPNLFFTKDLKNFTALSNLEPHRMYNWLTTTLITWKQFDSTISQGILYKPEDFDPLKKYPLIIHYYEERSHMLFDYLYPHFSTGSIDVAWYTSHGYLVFTPDIHYKAGEPGQSVYNAVVSAAEHLSRMPFVDGKRMGIAGHSFGGYETNYLVTHTGIFAAAAEAAGPGNFISSYGALGGPAGGEHESNQVKQMEQGQFRVGFSLWERPDLYIKNSPIFNADKVTTPLLMMHNKADPLVAWAQGIEFYTGLRRLQKKVWLLEYDNGSHVVRGKDAVDYTIRLMQFFDHYLKGAPPPKWMTKGIPASMKAIDTGLELDRSGAVP